MNVVEFLGFIMAFVLIGMTVYAIVLLIFGEMKMQWGNRKQKSDGILIINDTAEKQSWDIHVDTELNKLAKKKYIILEVHYYESNKYKKELSPEVNQWIKEWNPKEEEE